MNVKIWSLVGLSLTVAGTVVSAIAGKATQEMIINKTIDAKIIELTK